MILQTDSTARQSIQINEKNSSGSYSTMGMKRKAHGGATKDICLMDPVVLVEGDATELSAWLTAPVQHRERITALDLCA